MPEPEPAPDVEVEAEPEPEPAAPVVRPSIAGETMHTAMPEGEEEQKFWAATKIQAIERGRRWRQRIAAFERWDKTSGEGDFLQPRVAPEGVQCTSIPKQHLLDGEHFTPLGLRLAKQLFMLLDEVRSPPPRGGSALFLPLQPLGWRRLAEAAWCAGRGRAVEPERDGGVQHADRRNRGRHTRPRGAAGDPAASCRGGRGCGERAGG